MIVAVKTETQLINKSRTIQIPLTSTQDFTTIITYNLDKLANVHQLHDKLTARGTNGNEAVDLIVIKFHFTSKYIQLLKKAF